MHYLEIAVGARDSFLSRRQFEEVECDLKKFHPHICLRPIFIETTGDKDKKTSLRTLENSDFFTREIDYMQLKGECRIAIHSAKDLPNPLAKGLVLAALTHGLDPSDMLVMREGENQPAKVVATSSSRREKNILRLFPNVKCVDIRGNIQERLSKLYYREVDGVVVAEAALIRLGLTRLNRIKIPGETASLQGKLAIVALKDDTEMINLFSQIYLARFYSSKS
jgi:hydroxymethylbilane synthase